ncbi:response regulator [Dyadobacter bucti]|uniref:response regulator n=1 Tax=Dyadobacter bucti TaxID=2572203 RepID=UPI001408E981|nr:response regulator [Dyadobacter bucti]
MIDDDTDEHEIFNMAIEDINQPMDCLYFTDCESAIAYFSQPGVTPPSHVFMDLKLPRLQGDQCLEKLQQLRQFDHPFLVIYSSSISDEMQQKLLNSEIGQVIQKTDSIPELTETIRQVVLMP